jgi:hypothetical protein
MTVALGRQLSNTSYSAVIVACFYFIAAVILPVYNKLLFSGLAMVPVAPFPHALTATALQLWGVVLLVACALTYELVSLAWRGTRARFVERVRVSPLTLLQHTLLPALFFTGVIALSNLGIQRVSVALHVLLKAAELVAIVLAGMAIEREIPTWFGALCCLSVALGVALLSLDAALAFDASLEAVLLHVGAVLCGGLHVALMRRAWRKLADAAFGQLVAAGTIKEPLLADAARANDARAMLLLVRNETPLLRRVALIKLTVAATAITIAAAVAERGAWAALVDPAQTSAATDGLLAGGVLITVVYQMANIAMPRYAASLTVAVIEQLKVLPQLFLALFFRGQAALVYSAISFTDVLAASLIVCATVAYAAERRYTLRA